MTVDWSNLAQHIEIYHTHVAWSTRVNVIPVWNYQHHMNSDPLQIVSYKMFVHFSYGINLPAFLMVALLAMEQSRICCWVA